MPSRLSERDSGRAGKDMSRNLASFGLFRRPDYSKVAQPFEWRLTPWSPPKKHLRCEFEELLLIRQLIAVPCLMRI